jgi:hypothetical protein
MSRFALDGERDAIWSLGLDLKVAARMRRSQSIEASVLPREQNKIEHTSTSMVEILSQELDCWWSVVISSNSVKIFVENAYIIRGLCNIAECWRGRHVGTDDSRAY